MLLACMSMQTSAPAMSLKISDAMYSGMEPSFLPGKVLFMSRSNPGIPLVMESIPSGFRAGYMSTIPLRCCMLAFKNLASSKQTSCPSSSSPCVPVTMHILFASGPMPSGAILFF